MVASELVANDRRNLLILLFQPILTLQIFVKYFDQARQRVGVGVVGIVGIGVGVILLYLFVGRG